MHASKLIHPILASLYADQHTSLHRSMQSGLKAQWALDPWKAHPFQVDARELIEERWRNGPTRCSGFCASSSIITETLLL